MSDRVSECLTWLMTYDPNLTPFRSKDSQNLSRRVRRDEVEVTMLEGKHKLLQKTKLKSIGTDTSTG